MIGSKSIAENTKGTTKLWHGVFFLWYLHWKPENAKANCIGNEFIMKRKQKKKRILFL